METGFVARGSHHALRRASALTACILGAGLAMALAYSAVEAAANPGYTLADGYWIGRLPWMGIIEALVVAGATSSALVGAAAIAVLGGWVRRAATLPALALVGLWWFLAWARAGVSGGACLDCPPPPFDPWAYAYSAPLLAFEMLILPAIAIALLALTAPAAESRGSYISPS